MDVDPMEVATELVAWVNETIEGTGQEMWDAIGETLQCRIFGAHNGIEEREEGVILLLNDNGSRLANKMLQRHAEPGAEDDTLATIFVGGQAQGIELAEQLRMLFQPHDGDDLSVMQAERVAEAAGIRWRLIIAAVPDRQSDVRATAPAAYGGELVRALAGYLSDWLRELGAQESGNSQST